jgi:hypothetical protein
LISQTSKFFSVKFILMNDSDRIEHNLGEFIEFNREWQERADLRGREHTARGDKIARRERDFLERSAAEIDRFCEDVHEREINRSHELKQELSRQEEAARQELDDITRKNEISRREREIQARGVEFERHQRLRREHHVAITRNQQDELWTTLKQASKGLNAKGTKKTEIRADMDKKGKGPSEPGLDGNGEGFQDSGYNGSGLGNTSNLGRKDKPVLKLKLKKTNDRHEDNPATESSEIDEPDFGSTRLGAGSDISEEYGSPEVPGGEGSVFMTPIEAKSPELKPKGPKITASVTPKTTEPKPSVNEEDAGLVEIKGNKDGVVTHWRKKGDTNHMMIRYGPPGAARYLHTTRPVKKFDKESTP